MENHSHNCLLICKQKGYSEYSEKNTGFKIEVQQIYGLTHSKMVHSGSGRRETADKKWKRKDCGRQELFCPVSCISNSSYARETNG